MADFFETPTDPIGLTDDIVLSGDVHPVVTDPVGITDTAASAKTVTVTVTDTVGITDVAAYIDDDAEEITDTVGITDTANVYKALDIPSIDGGGEPVGVAVLELFDPVTNPVEVGMPSIDGASSPSGVRLNTAPSLATTNNVQGHVDNDAALPGGAESGVVYTVQNPTVGNQGDAFVSNGAGTWTNIGQPAFVPEVYAELWNAAGTAKLSDLLNQVSVEWQDVQNDTGVGSLVISRHDADASLITVGTQVRCYLYEQHVFTWIVTGPPEVTVFDPDNESAEELSVSGSGKNVLAADGLIYAPKGIDDPLNPAHRLYSFASIDYDEGSSGTPWVGAIQQYRADELDPFRYQLIETTFYDPDMEDTVSQVPVPPPFGWPDPTAYWIWGSTDRTRVGNCFFRKTFNVPTETTVAFVVAADNYYTLYLDGTPIIGEKVDARCWATWKREDIILPGGTYTLAAVVENLPLGFDAPAGFNPAGLLMSAFIPEGTTGDPDTFLVHSDSSWRALAYPATWPGWTPGQIMIDIIEEAQARLELLDLTYDFSELADSAGNPWPVTQGFSMPIGQSLLDALDSLVGQGWIDYRLAPGGLVLQAFVADWSPDSGVTLDVTGVEATTNIVTHEVTSQSTPKTRLLVKWSSGNFQLDDAGAQATYGVRPLFVSIDAATSFEAERRAQVILDNIKTPQEAIQIGLDPTGPADRPYQAFLIGERLTVPDRDEAPSLEKLLAISVGHEDVGKAIIGLELNTRVLTRERENEELLQQLGSGVRGAEKVRWSLYQTDPVVST